MCSCARTRLCGVDYPNCNNSPYHATKPQQDQVTSYSFKHSLVDAAVGSAAVGICVMVSVCFRCATILGVILSLALTILASKYTSNGQREVLCYLQHHTMRYISYMQLSRR